MLPLNFSTLQRSVWTRRAAWALGGLLLLWALAWMSVPGLVKTQIEERGSALLGRKLTVGAVDFKPWTLELTVTDIAMATADGTARQLGIARVYVDGEMSSLFHLAPVLDAVEVDAPTLTLTRSSAGHYDIDDIIRRLSAPSPQPASAPLKFALYNIALHGGSVDFTDAPVARQHAVRQLELTVPFLSSLDAKRDVKVEPHLAFTLNGSAFDSAAQGTPFAQTRKGDAQFKVSHFDVVPYLPYLPADLPVQPKTGVVDADLRLNFVQTPQVALSLSGTVKVSNLKLANAAGADLLGVDAIQAELADVRPLEQRVKLASLDISGPKLWASRNRAGELNLDLAHAKPAAGATKKEATHAVPTPATAEKDPKKPTSGWQLELTRFALHKGEVNWADDSAQPAAHLALTAVELQAQALHWPFAQVPAQFSGSVALATKDKPGRVQFEGQGTDQQGRVHATVTDLALDSATAFTARYLEPHLGGALEAALDATWQDGAVQVTVPHLAVRDFALLGGKSVKADKSAKVDKNNKADKNGKSAVSEMPRFKLLDVSDAQVDLNSQSVRVGKVSLRAPTATVQRGEDGHWMFEQWLKPQPVSTKAAPTKPWNVAVAELAIDEGALALNDTSLAKRVRLAVSDLTLRMQNLTLDGKKKTPLTVSARIKAGRTEPGTLRYKGTVMWSPVAVQGSVEARDIPAHAVAPYFADRLNLELLRADTSFKGQVRYAAAPAGPTLQLRGDAALEDFRANSVLSDKGDLRVAEELLSWKSLNVPGIRLAMAPGVATRLNVREAALTDFFARVVVRENGRLNLQDLVKSDAAVAAASAPGGAASVPAGATVAAPAASASPAVLAASAPAAGNGAPEAIVQMGPISLVNGKVLFSDHFIQPNYSADLSELTGKLSQFSSQPKDGVVQLADLDVRGRAEGTAALEITGKVNPLARPLALDIHGRVRDLELPPLSPYAIKYAGYGIERGKLSVDVQYTVQPDGQLSATNNIVLNQLTFGDEVAGAPHSLPVKLAVALLADRNGVIDLNLPISGSINDPEFRLGPVVFKLIMNLIVKAVTAPFSLLANAFGGDGGEELGTVVFAPGSSVLSAEAKAGLDKVVKALAERPSLKMTVTGAAALEQEREALKRERLKGLLLAEKRRRAVGGGQDAAVVGAVSEAEYPVLLKAVYRRADITKPRNFLGITKDISGPEMEALLLSNMAVTEDAMHELALQRGVAVKDYLATKDMPAERLFLGGAKVITPPANWKPQAELSLTMH